MTNLLITGASGYIGTATKDHLNGSGINVIGIDFDKANNEINLLDFTKLKCFIYENKIDAVLHLAAFKSIPDSKSNPTRYLHNNIASSLNIISICEDFKIPLVNASTAAVYGKGNPYSESKLMVEKFLESSHLNYINLRYFNIGGLIAPPNSRQISNIFDIIRFKHANNKKFIINGNDSMRNYTHIKDIAKFNAKRIEDVLSNGNRSSMDVYSTNTVSVEDIVLMYKDLGIMVDYEMDHTGETRDHIVPSGEGLISDGLSMRDIIESEIKYGIVLDNRI